MIETPIGVISLMAEIIIAGQVLILKDAHIGGAGANRWGPGNSECEKLSLSQDDFALMFGLDVATLRNWEQGRSEPDRARRTILWTIAINPDAVKHSLEERENPAAEWAIGL